MNVHFPETFLESKFLFYKKFLDITEDMQKHYYCENCENYLGLMTGIDIIGLCDHCEVQYSKEKIQKSSSYFYYIPIKPQIEQLLQDTTVANSIGSAFGVMTGELYKKTTRTLENDDLTLLWNTDGVPVFSSSNTSFWPLQCVLNELPHKLQRENVILAGLWFGQGKPRLSTFLKPFVDECNSLTVTWLKDGIIVTSTIKVILCTADAVARPLLKNTNQFNGRFGCDWCYNEGLQVKKGLGTIRVYPYNGPDHPSARVKTSELHLRDAMQAHASGNICNGVKGVTILLNMPPCFDIIEGFVPDFMHSVLLGVTRQFTGLWLDASHHDKPWHLQKDQQQLVDDFILAQKSPTELARCPRSLIHRKFWKASEWRSFLLIYSPIVLKDVLPVKYFNHWMLLVISLHLLCQDVVSPENMSTAEVSLHKFVILVENLYGIEHVSYNVHQMIHLANAVKQWGPLWSSSAFLFENNNGNLLKLFHGTKHVSQQVCKSYLLQKLLFLKASSVFSQTTYFPARKLLGQFLSRNIFHNQYFSFSEEITLYGKFASRKLTFVERTALHLFVRHINGYVKSYQRLLFKGHLFSTSNYCNKFKRNNSIACMKNGTFIQIISIIVSTHCNCSSVHMVNCYHPQSGFVIGKILKPNGLLFNDRQVALSSRNIMFEVNLNLQEIKAFPFDQLSRKCAILTKNDARFVVALPNMSECE